MAFDEDMTGRIIHCVIRVHQTLGPGYSEKVYRRAMVVELQRQSLAIEVEKVVFIYYEGIKVGRHVIDIVVENKVILELKVVDALGKAHYAQVRSYLKSTGINVALLVNSIANALIIGELHRHYLHHRHISKKKRFPCE